MNPMHMFLNALRPSRRSHRPIANLVVLFILAAAALAYASDSPTNDRHADLDQLVAETHKASLKVREEALRKTIAKDTAWPPGIWGDNLWTLSALYLNEKVDEANVRLLKQANDYIAMIRKHGHNPSGGNRTTRKVRDKGDTQPTSCLCGFGPT